MRAGARSGVVVPLPAPDSISKSGHSRSTSERRADRANRDPLAATSQTAPAAQRATATRRKSR